MLKGFFWLQWDTSADWTRIRGRGRTGRSWKRSWPISATCCTTSKTFTLGARQRRYLDNVIPTLLKSVDLHLLGEPQSINQFILHVLNFVNSASKHLINARFIVASAAGEVGHRGARRASSPQNCR